MILNKIYLNNNKPQYVLQLCTNKFNYQECFLMEQHIRDLLKDVGHQVLMETINLQLTYYMFHIQVFDTSEYYLNKVHKYLAAKLLAKELIK